jgi:hypothetical protein
MCLASPSNGCESCLAAAKVRGPYPAESFEELPEANDAFHGHSYFHCGLYRCRTCGVCQADVYFEWDDAETANEEWGHRERFARLLTAAQLATIEAARGTRSIDVASFFGVKQ